MLKSVLISWRQDWNKIEGLGLWTILRLITEAPIGLIFTFQQTRDLAIGKSGWRRGNRTVCWRVCETTRALVFWSLLIFSANLAIGKSESNSAIGGVISTPRIHVCISQGYRPWEGPHCSFLHWVGQTFRMEEDSRIYQIRQWLAQASSYWVRDQERF